VYGFGEKYDEFINNNSKDYIDEKDEDHIESGLTMQSYNELPNFGSESQSVIHLTEDDLQKLLPDHQWFSPKIQSLMKKFVNTQVQSTHNERKVVTSGVHNPPITLTMRGNNNSSNTSSGSGGPSNGGGGSSGGGGRWGHSSMFPGGGNGPHRNLSSSRNHGGGSHRLVGKGPYIGSGMSHHLKGRSGGGGYPGGHNMYGGGGPYHSNSSGAHKR